ncbi:GerAB/ArcD/ProY family transporter [Paenibacillus aestuarii]|uniref:Endospore germination permease n=1 Tax=Paenibacillus aestuarii TaxID=516965 RepID=A0ABW0KB60_9BACL|nr:endospore germination permease [Paenibacillus aestuarii]
MNPSNEQISTSQLFLLMVAFETGSAIIFGIGSDAKQDAWISILLASAAGAALLLIFFGFMTKLPSRNLFQVMEFALGKPIAVVFTYLYVIYFFYICMRVDRDLIELMKTTLLTQTPVEILHVCLFILCMYLTSSGLQIIGRIGELFAPILIGFLFLIGFLLIFDGNVSFKKLLPVMGEGVGPIIQAAFPSVMTFPFGELIAFTMIIPFTTMFSKARRISMYAILVSSLGLVFSCIIQIGTIGVDGRDRATYPLLSSARILTIGYFIERIDALATFMMMLGIVVKVSVYFYGGLKGLEHLTNIRYQRFVLPMGLILSVLSVTVAHNFAEHVFEGIKLVPYVLHIPFQIGFPCVLCGIVLWKLRKRAAAGNQP